MSETSGGLSLMAQTQNSRYLTFNELAWALNVLQTGVIDRDLAAPPGGATDGDSYVVDGPATGAWTGRENDIAFYFGGIWNFLAPELVQGRGIYVQDEGVTVRWSPEASPVGYEVINAGDVVGPSSATDSRIAAFDGTTGKLLKDGGKTIAELRAPSIQAVTSSATVTPTFSDDMVKITAQAAALDLANPTGTAIPGLGIVIRIKDNGTARAITYGSQYRAIGITLPTTTVISKTTYIAMIWNSDDSKWDCVATGTEA